MEMFKDFLLHVSFILFPIFLYHALWLSRTPAHFPKRNKLLITIFASISSALCIMYPVGSILDLQTGLQSIPLVLAILYGGYTAGIVAILFSSIVKFVMYGSFLWVGLIVVPIYFFIPFLFYRKWHQYSKMKKLLYGVLIGLSKGIFIYIGLFVVSLMEYSPAFIMQQKFLELFFSTLYYIFFLVLSIYSVEFVKENAQMRTQLVQSEKLTIVSELAASVAHEVRNPLTVVRGFIQLLFSSDNAKEPSTNKDYKNLVLSELDRAQDIITSYLDIAKQNYYQIESLNLSKLLEECASLMTSYANFKSVTIHQSIEPDLYIQGDETKIKQVMINLIKNAIEAAPDHEGKIELFASKENHKICLYFVDNGVGMTESQMKKLGEPYYTLKNKGTGLGLTVTFSIIENHHGTIRFKSSLQSGTTVTVKFPEDTRRK
ncbi:MULTISPECIES: sensor histidine kinase [Bacillus]|uniref:sensor histidine kinase n=1 Tax=Bacillus TaxID=1386 RepID=UPI001E3D05A3|nr:MULTISPECIES: HAMP domain-containing sensor histidine kinase [Bacillus]MCC9088721.1 HAMP domain-containing histidine kinase [Bacillus pumilus]